MTRSRTAVKTRSLLALLTSLLACAASVGRAAQASNEWRYPGLRFRVPLTVHAGLYPRDDCLVAWSGDSAALLQGAGADGQVATNSIVIVTDNGQQMAALLVPKADSGWQVRWRMPGKLDILGTRRFWAYFDARGEGMDPPQRPSLGGAELTALPPDDPPNLARNSGFEIADSTQSTMPADWQIETTPESKGHLELVGHPAHSGQRALLIQGISGDKFGVRQEHIPMKPNTLYRVGVWGRADAANTNELVCLRVLVVLRNAAGQPVSLQRAGIEVAHAVTPDSWTYIQKRGLMIYHSDVRTPPDTASGDLKIYVWSDPKREISMAGTVYIDDVELIEVRPQDLVPGVSVEAGNVERK